MRELVVFLVAALALLVVGIAGAESPQCSAKACDLDKNGVGSRLPDYAVFLAAFGSKRGELKFNPLADIDNSGTITTMDFAVFQKFCPLQ
jgi:hypothetical protein